jgi:glutathione S-transferase
MGNAPSAARGGAAAARAVHWDSKTCPYAQRAWIALLMKEVPFTVRVCDLENKDAVFKAKYASLNPLPGAPAKVPILEDADGAALIESGVIVEYLAARYRGQGVELVPADAAAAARSRLWAELFGAWVTAALFALLQARSAAGVVEGRAALAAGLAAADEFLRAHGSDAGGAFVLGAAPSVGDVMTVSFLQRALVALPAHRGVDPRALMKEGGLARLEAWADAVLALPAARETKPADAIIIASLAKFVAPLEG